MVDIIKNTDPELTLLKNNKESGYEYRERRQNDWKETYTLYRDKVTINRLTQRQSVNLPLMKSTIRTLLKDVDDMPVLYFENLDNDKDAEIFQNEYWKWTVDYNHMELQDIVDKRQVFLYGRSFDQMQILDGKVKFTIQDPEDLLVDRYMDPTDLDSSRFLIHTHIFVPLATLEGNPLYDQKKVAELKKWHANKEGIIKAASNARMLTEKNKKMSDMGLADVESPILGETYIELSLHFTYRKEKKESNEKLYLYIEADDYNILQKKPLDEVIGKTKDHYWASHFPYNTWADDLDRQDFWSDGIGDIVRTPNKVLNSWFSQLVENRTLRNYGMHYFDSTIEGFVPQTFEPIPWGWYGVPGKPDDIIKKVDVPDLSESLDEMQYVVSMIEKSTGATPTMQGIPTQSNVPLGEVQLMLQQAKEKVKGMSKFYTEAWKSRGEKFLKLIEAAPGKLDAVTIYKKGRNTNNMFSREISSKDWVTKSGYTTKVWSQDEKNMDDMKGLEKINNAMLNIPGNPKLTEIYQRKLLEYADLTPDEINDVMETEEQKRQAMANMEQVTGMQGIAGGPGQPPQAVAQKPQAGPMGQQQPQQNKKPISLQNQLLQNR